MPRAATIVLSVAAVLGLLLTLWHIRVSEGRGRPPWLAGLVHGAIGLVGLGLMLTMLRQPKYEVVLGAEAFSTGSVLGIGLGALAGIGFAVLSRRRAQFAPLLLMTHILLALSGFLLFIAWSTLY